MNTDSAMRTLRSVLRTTTLIVAAAGWLGLVSVYANFEPLSRLLVGWLTLGM